MGKSSGGARPPTSLLSAFLPMTELGTRWVRTIRRFAILQFRRIASSDNLLQFAESKVGAGNVLVILTADHGVSPVPAVNEKRRMPGGVLSYDTISQKLQSSLAGKYGNGDWVVSKTALQTPFLNGPLILSKKLDETEVQNTAADAIRRSRMWRAFTPGRS